MSFMEIRDFIDANGGSYDSIINIAYQHRKETGDYPSWYKIVDGRIYINESIKRPSIIDHNVWVYNTDPDGVYWFLSNVVGLSDRQIAEICSEKSKKYKKIKSWLMFFTYDLFNLYNSEKKIYSYRYTMQIDFLVIMTRWIYENIILKRRQNESM